MEMGKVWRWVGVEMGGVEMGGVEMGKVWRWVRCGDG